MNNTNAEDFLNTHFKPTKPDVRTEEWEKELAEILDLLDPEDEDTEEARYVQQLRYNLHKFIRSLIKEKQRDLFERINEGLSVTWDQSESGYCGYRTLPNCKKEHHEIKECADCFLTSLKADLEDKK
jgi:hypothetical protein